MNLFKQLAEGGAYNLPVLIHLSAGDTDIYLINDNVDMEYNGHTYAASTFSFKQSSSGDAQIQVELVKHEELIDLFENNDAFTTEIVGVYNEGNDTVESFSMYRFKYGTATWTGKSAQIKLDKDDRLDMTFPALTFNSYNNRGNT